MIYKKMINILQDADFISKDKAAEQGYKFRGIDDMYNALHPLFAKHGIFISSEVVNGFREERKTKNGGNLIYSIIDVRFTFWAEDGSNVSSTMRGEAMDMSDKASNKAMSAALKYALIQAFLIPTEEKIDTEYEDHKPVIKPEGNYDGAMDALTKADTKEKLDNIIKMLDTRSWNEGDREKLLMFAQKKITDFMAETIATPTGLAERIANTFQGEIINEN
jgi:hypothetical protein